MSVSEVKRAQCSLSGKEAEGLTVQIEGDLRPVFLSSRSLLQLLKLKMGLSPNGEPREEKTNLFAEAEVVTDASFDAA